MTDKKNPPAGGSRGKPSADYTDPRLPHPYIPQHPELAAANAVAYPPAGRRTNFLVVVDPCPYCGKGHHHYARSVSSARGAIRTGCSRPYELVSVRLRGGVDV